MTMGRMDMVRGAMLSGDVGRLPISTAAPRQESVEREEHNIKWWPPEVTGDQVLFETRMIRERGEKIIRYPHEGEAQVISLKAHVQRLLRKTEKTKTNNKENEKRREGKC